jgi:hypothetical protein
LSLKVNGSALSALDFQTLTAASKNFISTKVCIGSELTKISAYKGDFKQDNFVLFKIPV